jgi:hypothetical protein
MGAAAWSEVEVERAGEGGGGAEVEDSTVCGGETRSSAGEALV